MAELLYRCSRLIFSRHCSRYSQQYLALASSPAHLRNYSQYPTYFKEPIIPQGSKDVVLESEAFKEVEHLPVRAALNFYTSSMFLDPLVMKFVNHVMDHGRKDVARRIVDSAFQRVKRVQLEKYHAATPEERDNIELDPVKIFHKAIQNARPFLTTTRLRLGSTWYQVPRAVTEQRATSIAMKWFVEVCNDKPKGTRFHNRLAAELIGASEYTGRVIQKKVELHKLCEANKAYAHFRWG